MGAQGLQLTKLVSRGCTLVKLAGPIDEHLTARAFEGITGIAVIDLDGVTRVTSYGVRSWLGALRNLKAAPYYFVAARPTVVAQLNMISGFAAAGTLVTMYAPYECGGCGKSFEVLLDLRTAHPAVAAFQVPDARCPQCGAAGELDDLPESYFSYAAAAPAPTMDPVAAQLLDQAVVVPLKVKHTQEGTVTVLQLSGTIDKAGGLRRVGEGLEGTVVVDLGAVIGVNARGSTGFTAFASLEGVTMYLQRVPLAVASELAAVAGGFGRARICSLAISTSCPACRSDQTVGLMAPMLANMIGGNAAQVACPNCGGALALFDQADALALADLPLVTDEDELMRLEAARRAGVVDEGGDEMFGKYKLVRRIGAGGMAEVFLARQSGPMGFERSVVLKRILPHLSVQDEFVAMFLQEARLAARLSHPNIVQVFELGEERGQYYMALEYVKGWDLRVILREAHKHGVTMPVPLACRMVSSVCAALHAAHSNKDDANVAAGIVHRDVTPHNVLVSSAGNVKLSDFGIAKLASAVSETGPGLLKGKLAYIAPEVVRSGSAASARADVYAAGLVLYEVLTFQQPFKRDDDAATMHAVVYGDIPELAVARPDAPAGLQAVIARATARSPEERYETALEMQLALERLVSASGKTVTDGDLGTWLDDLARVAGLDAPHLAEGSHESKLVTRTIKT